MKSLGILNITFFFQVVEIIEFCLSCKIWLYIYKNRELFDTVFINFLINLIVFSHVLPIVMVLQLLSHFISFLLVNWQSIILKQCNEKLQFTKSSSISSCFFGIFFAKNEWKWMSLNTFELQWPRCTYKVKNKVEKPQKLSFLVSEKQGKVRKFDLEWEPWCKVNFLWSVLVFFISFPPSYNLFCLCSVLRIIQIFLNFTQESYVHLSQATG